MHLWFRTLDRFLTRAPEWSRATVGAMLAPVDIALTRIVHEGPSIEIMVCRKST
jgi:hypothetical protein